MGTEYELYDDDLFGKLTIDEMSNKLSLCFDSGEIYGVHPSRYMTPEDMAKIFLKGLTVCSYWMDLKEMILKHVDKELY